MGTKGRQLQRIWAVWFVFLLGTLGLGGRVYWLQLREGLQLRSAAVAQQQTSVTVPQPRRAILDRQGNLLAGDRLTYTLYVHPRYFQQSGHSPAEVAEFLAGFLPEESAAELEERFTRQATGIRLPGQLTEEMAKRIRAGIVKADAAGASDPEAISGLDLEPQYSRYYPRQKLAASVIGYVRQGEDRRGQAGVELQQSNKLARDVSAEPIQALRARNGQLLPRSLPADLHDLDERSLQLSLDLRLQQVVQDILGKQMESFGAKRGAVIVMDVHTGELLSLVELPTYDPNAYFEAFDLKRFERDPELNPFKNWSISDLYEPGSTFKPINIAIALEAGVVEPETAVYDPGKVDVGGWTIRNHNYHQRGGNGSIDLAKILQVSSNVGMIRVMNRLTPKSYYDKLLELGMQEKTGIDLPGELAGRLKAPSQFLNYPIEPAVTAFGQGFSLTPMKLAQLHAAIANGGELVTPHVVTGWVDAEGNVLERTQPQPPKRVFSRETAEQVLLMMETVVDKGSGKASRIPGYRVGGKTGTAQKAGRNHAGYGKGRITSFVGLLPIEAPRYVVLAVVDEPTRGQPFGSTVAAPIVKKVMETLIALEGLPPTSNPEAAP